jgi:hypothetical protein
MKINPVSHNTINPKNFGDLYLINDKKMSADPFKDTEIGIETKFYNKVLKKTSKSLAQNIRFLGRWYNSPNKFWFIDTTGCDCPDLDIAVKEALGEINIAYTYINNDVFNRIKEQQIKKMGAQWTFKTVFKAAKDFWQAPGDNK